MSNSDSFFDDDSLEMDSFAGEPSEELLRESSESFADLDASAEGFSDQADTPDAVLDSEDPIVGSIDDEVAADLVVEEAAAVAATGAEAKSRFNIDWAELTIFDAILFVSLLFISLAALLMFFELRNFGNFPFGGFPWRTDGF